MGKRVVHVIEEVAVIEGKQVIVLTIGQALIAIASKSFMAVLGNREKLTEKVKVAGHLLGFGDAQISIMEAEKHKSKII